MSIVMRFSPRNLTSAKYDDVKRRLDEGGHWPPPGLEYHICFGTEDELRVSEIWSDGDQAEAFRAHLSPILEEIGIEQAAPPEVFEVYNQERF